MRGKWIKMCIIVFGLLLCSACSKKEEKKVLEEVQELEAPSEEEQRKTSEPEADTIYVYVCGQVKCPGVYELKNSSRLYEAVDAAGGMTKAAADTYLNQAESLKDGQKVYVPSKEEIQTMDVPVSEEAPEDGKVDLNQASKEELMTLSGIGEARADAILKYRQDHGGFRSAEELKEVEGIKDGIYDKIKEQIKVS